MSATIDRGSGRSTSRMVTSGSSWMIGARLGRTLITIIGMIFLARLLTPTDFGVLAFSTSATVLSLVILEGAIDIPATRVDELTVDGVRSLVWGAIVVVCLLGAATWFGAPALERAMRFPRLALGLRAVIPVFFAQIWITAGTAVLRRQHHFRAVALLGTLSNLCYVATAVTLAFAGFGLLAALIAQIAANVLVGLLFAWRARIGLAPPHRFNVDGIGAASLGGAVARLVAWAWTNVDTFAVSMALGPAATGLYTRAYNVNVQLKEPFYALDLTMRQAFASLKSREGGFAAQNYMAFRLVTLASGITAAAAIILREPMVLVLLGRQWAPAEPVIALLAASLPARIARMYMDSLSSAAGSVGIFIARQVFLLIVIGTGVAFVAPHGIPAVAIVISLALYASLLLPQTAVETARFGGLADMLATMVPGLLCGAGIVLVGEWGIRPLTEGRALLRFGLDVLLLGAVTGGVLLLLPNAWLPGNLIALRARVLPFRRARA